MLLIKLNDNFFKYLIILIFHPHNINTLSFTCAMRSSGTAEAGRRVLLVPPNQPVPILPLVALMIRPRPLTDATLLASDVIVPVEFVDAVLTRCDVQRLQLQIICNYNIIQSMIKTCTVPQSNKLQFIMRTCLS